MTNYTIVAYRPNHVDLCRNCVVGTTNSEIEFGFFSDLFAAAVHAAGYTKRPEEADSSYADWEITLLVDGLDENQWWSDRDWLEVEYDPFDDFRSMHAKAVQEVEARRIEADRIRKEKEAERKRKEAAKAAQLKEEAEREQLRVLKGKYPDEA